MSTLLLAAVVGSWVEPGVTLSANHLVAVVLLGQNLHRWLNDTSTKPQHQVESRLFLDVVVTQSPTIFKLLPRKNKSLLIWRDSYGEGQPGTNRSVTRKQSDSGTRNETYFNPHLPCPESSPLHSQ